MPLPVDILKLIQLQTKPEPFSPGEPLFWDDPHISSQMLMAHLDPEVDAASRRPETIEQTVTWLIDHIQLQSGQKVLDLGCGPGLYSVRFAQRGITVTGIDYSYRSIDYANQSVENSGLPISFRFQDYLTLEDANRYDAAFLIYGDFCVFSPMLRTRLLANVHRALKPGGQFVLDVSTRQQRNKLGLKNNWYAAESGFWRPGPHLVLENGFDYPERSIFLDQYLVIEPDGKISVYRNWFQDYSPESIRTELEAGGFTVEGVWGDLAGSSYTDASDWIGVIAKRA